ncbi:MAG TPA: hypothetical protein PKD00_01560 [Burkholderiales bacterium]|nr:hypothetical protein [Burkholderiales bacterium]
MIYTIERTNKDITPLLNELKNEGISIDTFNNKIILFCTRLEFLAVKKLAEKYNVSIVELTNVSFY